MKFSSSNIENKNIELINRADYTTDLDYLKDIVFIKSLVYVYSFSFLVLIPCVLHGIYMNNYWIVFWEILTYLIVLFLTFPLFLKLHIRKWIFILSIYLLGFQLLIQLGMDGAGILFWIIGNISCSLLIKKTQLIFVVLINVVVFSIIAIMIYLGDLPISFSKSLTLDDWILITIHNIYLSIIISSILNELLKILERVLYKENKLHHSILKAAEKTSQSIHLNEMKNTKLEQIAFVTARAIKPPLKIVQQRIQLLNDSLHDKLEEKANKYLHFATEGTHKMALLIAGMDKLSRIDEHIVKIETLDIANIIHKSVASYILENPTIELTIASENQEIQTDEYLITRLIALLIDNCFMYRKRNSSLLIHVTIENKNKERWMISITDNGIGIDSNQMSRIFQLYQRLHKQTDIPGEGIGLSLAKRIVNKLDGEIWVESKRNIGTTFYISLPKNLNYELD